MKGYKLTIIVNVASKWAFAHKNYVELVNVYEEYKSYGMQVVAFPSSQFFSSQESVSKEEIIAFSRTMMGATFPIMEKCDVNGEAAHIIFKLLRKTTACFYNKETGKIKNIPWNFAKFVVDESGSVVMYQNPRESLYRTIDEIEAVLGLRGGEKEAQGALQLLKQSMLNKTTTIWSFVDQINKNKKIMLASWLNRTNFWLNGVA